MFKIFKMKKRWVAAFAILVAAFLFLKSQYALPILMYHHVGEPRDLSGLNVSAETFERQMEFLKIHHIHVLSLEEVARRVRMHEALPMNAVVITFDDGYLDNIENAFPILKKMGFPATIFMITENIGRPGWLSDEDLRILDESGISIGSHTVHHAYLPDLIGDQISKELRDSKQTLEAILGRPVTLLSYPAGGWNPAARQAADDAGYLGAVTTNHGKGPADFLALWRVKISEGRGSLFNFWIKTSGFYHLGKKHVSAE